MHAHNRAKLPEASPPRVPRERRVQRARSEARLNDRVVDELPRRVVEVVLPVADLALALRHVARHAPKRDRLSERGALRGRERPAEEGGDPVELRLEVELEVLVVDDQDAARRGERCDGALGREHPLKDAAVRVRALRRAEARERPRAVLVAPPAVLGLAAEEVERGEDILWVAQAHDQPARAGRLHQPRGQEVAKQVGREEPRRRHAHEKRVTDQAGDWHRLGRRLHRAGLWVDLHLEERFDDRAGHWDRPALVVQAVQQQSQDLVQPRRARLDGRAAHDIVRPHVEGFERLRRVFAEEEWDRQTLPAPAARHRTRLLGRQHL
mmetsp:Transcript_18695/g.61655  ORF Transcript_18695/g.61655 Transcript_18695/m.61655 type:complete len:324 (+) Transcript_18695:252-1223(+)